MRLKVIVPRRILRSCFTWGILGTHSLVVEPIGNANFVSLQKDVRPAAQVAERSKPILRILERNSEHSPIRQLPCYNLPVHQIAPFVRSLAEELSFAGAAAGGEHRRAYTLIANAALQRLNFSYQFGGKASGTSCASLVSE